MTHGPGRINTLLFAAVVISDPKKEVSESEGADAGAGEVNSFGVSRAGRQAGVRERSGGVLRGSSQGMYRGEQARLRAACTCYATTESAGVRVSTGTTRRRGRGMVRDKTHVICPPSGEVRGEGSSAQTCRYRHRPLYELCPTHVPQLRRSAFPASAGQCLEILSLNFLQ